jgi:hypothetical protein
MLLKKKSQGGLFYNIKLLSQNIAINSFSIKHEHAHKVLVVVKNGSCITSHNKHGEQAFYAKYTRK